MSQYENNLQNDILEEDNENLYENDNLYNNNHNSFTNQGLNIKKMTNKTLPNTIFKSQEQHLGNYHKIGTIYNNATYLNIGNFSSSGNYQNENYNTTHKPTKRENSIHSMHNKSVINTLSNETEEFSMISQDGNKLRFQLMEKDKIIIEYTKVLKETERVLENTKKLNFSKDELISNLRDEIKTLKFKLKNSELSLQNKIEESEKFRKFTEDKIFILNTEKSNLEEKLDEITKIYENNQIDFQNTLIEYKKMEKQLIKLNKNFGEKNEQICNIEKFNEELKKDNKNIPLLKKQINEMEKNISELKNEIQNEHTKKEKILGEKEELAKKFKEQFEEHKVEKDANMKIIKMSYEIEGLKKEIEDKSKENEKLTEKNKSTLKENDNFVQFFSNELNEFLNLLESFGSLKGFSDSRNFFDLNLKNFNQHKKNYLQERKYFPTNNSSSPQLNFKYELVNKNFELLKNKIFDNFNEFINFSNRREKKEIELETQIKELTTERTNLIKEISLNKQRINEYFEKNNDISVSYEKLIEDFKSLKEKYVKTKTELEEETRKNENICKEIHLFLSICYERLKEKFPNADNEFDNKSNYNLGLNSLNSQNIPIEYTEKLLYLIDIVINENDKLSKQEKELYETLKMTQMEIKNIQDEKESLKYKIDRVLQAKEENDKNSELMKNEELKRQREVLYEKISSLTTLLEESNSMITLYEDENKELKEKLGKLEFNLKMLTKSHMELENSITGGATVLQLEIDDKENKYNNSLREIELKNIHIESIENILKRKDEEIGRLNEILFIYKNNISSNSQGNVEEKNLENSENIRESKGKNYSAGDYNERNVNDNSSGNNFNNSIKNTHNSCISSMLHNRNYSTNHNQYEQSKNNYDEFENKRNITNSQNTFLINEQNEKELQKLISAYNFEKNENSLPEEKFESYSNRQIKTKVPGRIYSIKNVIN